MGSHHRTIGALRAMKYSGVIVVLVEDPSLESLLACLNSGADDYWMSSARLDIEIEAIRLLGYRASNSSKSWNPDAIGEMGLLRSMGLTKGQIDTL
ncbi:MAG: hypothetical protein GY854_23770 [Deltaproteobacteria bacterium]|nr:hypothetical protein [Deltaproteobacteria bacterium]